MNVLQNNEVTKLRRTLTYKWLLVLGFVVLFLALRWYLVARYGSATPFYDQWDAEAAHLYTPWIEGRLGWIHLFQPHNEHRILTARILLLGLFSLIGNQWDTLLQMQVNDAF
jgi:hypothetical protein